MIDTLPTNITKLPQASASTLYRGWTIHLKPSGDNWTADACNTDGKFGFTATPRADPRHAVWDAQGLIDRMIAQDADPSAMPGCVAMSDALQAVRDRHPEKTTEAMCQPAPQAVIDALRAACEAFGGD